jgi:uncharacterized protein YndB with AHSA1/START domain
MTFTIETIVRAPLAEVWQSFNTPADFKQWNAPQDDWHTTTSSVDLREGGQFKAHMEAKDGGEGFDFEGVYTRVVPRKAIDYQMSDGRRVHVEFIERPDDVLIHETIETEDTHPFEQQRKGWQQILNNFGRHVESKS